MNVNEFIDVSQFIQFLKKFKSDFYVSIQIKKKNQDCRANFVNCFTLHSNGKWSSKTATVSTFIKLLMQMTKFQKHFY